MLSRAQSRPRASEAAQKMSPGSALGVFLELVNGTGCSIRVFRRRLPKVHPRIGVFKRLHSVDYSTGRCRDDINREAVQHSTSADVCIQYNVIESYF